MLPTPSSTTNVCLCIIMAPRRKLEKIYKQIGPLKPHDALSFHLLSVLLSSSAPDTVQSVMRVLERDFKGCLVHKGGGEGDEDKDRSLCYGLASPLFLFMCNLDLRTLYNYYMRVDSKPHLLEKSFTVYNYTCPPSPPSFPLPFLLKCIVVCARAQSGCLTNPKTKEGGG